MRSVYLRKLICLLIGILFFIPFFTNVVVLHTETMVIYVNNPFIINMR